MEQVGGGAPAPESAEFVLEKSQRLSASLIWRAQRDFYDRRGEQAWLSDRIPSYATSNALIAKSYARVVSGFLRDCARASPPLGPLDPQAPLYILEIAAGSGQFGFLFLKKLLALQRELPALAHFSFRYVMTDLAPANVDAWRSRDVFKPFLEAGVLDFATFDLERDQTITLVHSGETLSADTLHNPLALIANYVFDSTAQDVFWVSEGELKEGLVTTTSSRREETALDPEVLKRVTTRYEQRPVGEEYYEDEAMNRVLAAYRTRLGNTSFLFPIGALKGIRNLIRFSGGRLLLLSGDKGHTHEDELNGRGDPQMTLHSAAFSMMVNYHAIGLYFRERGGLALHSSSRDKRLKVSAFLMGAPDSLFGETQSAFHEAVDGFGACEYCALAAGIRKELPAPSLDVLLALFKLGEWDPYLIYHFAGPLADQAKTASEAARRELVKALRQAWDLFYPMDKDLPFEMGRIYAGLDRHLDALRFYLESVKLYKDHPATLFNAGLCLYSLHRPQEALTLLEQALELREGYAPAEEWRARIQSELAAR
ncbi:MAG TPA: tetratricopeptide repeat protein [Vicinamibacteria bacterium]|nr:tetratricopeptide repeat protein [Vicinamibacteria bacterium]